MKIAKVKVENFQRIELVEIEPDGSVVEITGRNRQGKSSLIGAIVAALGGRDVRPPRPVRKGEKRAHVELTLDDGTAVEWVRTEKSERLKLTNPEGAAYPSPQTRLGELVGRIAFDPLALASQPRREQRETLLRALGVDFSKQDAKRARLYENRRDVNRQLRELESQLNAAVDWPDDTPDEEVSLAELTDELEAARQHNRSNAAKREFLQAQTARVRDLRETVKSLEAELDNARNAVSDAEKLRERMKTAADQTEDVDTEELRERLGRSEDINAHVRAKRAHATRTDRRDEVAKESADLTAKIQALDEAKVKAIRKAKLPIPGLGISDDAVTLGGVPFEQASQSEQIRACTAIAAALNPELRVAFVRQGNDLDSESLAEFYEVCEEMDLQAWVERIEATRADALVIEAGQIKGDATP